MRDCCLINGRRILDSFLFKTEVRIQYTGTHAFFSAVYSLLRPKSLCLWGYLQRQGFLRIQVCLCNRSKPIKRQKKKRGPLTQKQRRRTHIALLFVFQRLKIGCFKTAVHATDVVPRLGMSSLFCRVGSCSYSEPPASVSTLHAVIQMMKKYRKQCILRHHEINDRA